MLRHVQLIARPLASCSGQIACRSFSQNVDSFYNNYSVRSMTKQDVYPILHSARKAIEADPLFKAAGLTYEEVYPFFEWNMKRIAASPENLEVTKLNIDRKNGEIANYILRRIIYRKEEDDPALKVVGPRPYPSTKRMADILKLLDRKKISFDYFMEEEKLLHTWTQFGDPSFRPFFLSDVILQSLDTQKLKAEGVNFQVGDVTDEHTLKEAYTGLHAIVTRIPYLVEGNLLTVNGKQDMYVVGQALNKEAKTQITGRKKKNPS